MVMEQCQSLLGKTLVEFNIDIDPVSFLLAVLEQQAKEWEALGHVCIGESAHLLIVLERERQDSELQSPDGRL
jgi:hypothetical protein